MKRLIEICNKAARTIHNGRPPNDQYAQSVASLLIGTIAQESAAGRYRRQVGFGWNELRGAWGVTQLESGSVGDSIKLLQRKPVLSATCAEFLAGHVRSVTLGFLYMLEPLDLMRHIAINDPLAIMFCRLHYLRIPAMIPDSLHGWARYWKQYYNTMKGKGTEAQFLANYKKYILDT